MLYSRSVRKRELLPNIDLVFFDEAHQASAPTFREAALSVKGATLVGLSATPGRADISESGDLTSLFSQRLITSPVLGPRPIPTLVKRGVLAELSFQKIDLGSSWPGITVTRRNLGKTHVKKLECDLRRFSKTIETILAIPKEERALVFAGSIAHANALWAVLTSQGEGCSVITNDTPPEQRRASIEDFSEGRTRILINKQILATGYDCPATKHVVLSVPIGSPILFEQIVGRVSRGPAVGGNRVGTVWEIDDNLKIHGLPTSYYRYRDIDWY